MSCHLPPRSAWSIPEDVIYLNHGSFGPAARVVQESREEWSRRLERQPMDFYLRQMEPALDEAVSDLAEFIGSPARNLAFVDNATVAMNVVAQSIALQADDEVLLNDHEYGAVFRIWRHRCQQVGARVVTAKLPVHDPANQSTNDESTTVDPDILNSKIVTAILGSVTKRTRLIVVSHVTSPSAIVLPVAEVCRHARKAGVPVCIDGPHAIAMREVNLQEIDCDFYCASLHKWLGAPLGSGFLFVRPDYQRRVQSPLTSWGRSLSGQPERWQDSLNWLGTRDPAPFLAVPAAIQFLKDAGWNNFRQRTHELAQYARQRIEARWGLSAEIPESRISYGSMIAIPLRQDGYQKPKPNAMHPLQQELRERFRIEVPVTACSDRFFLRISCHLYNTQSDIDQLIEALECCKYCLDDSPVV